MPDDRDEDELVRRQRTAFGLALEEAITRSGLSQDEVSRRLAFPRGQGSISEWKAGRKEPRPHIVFALERVLGVPPGGLSIHLGYLPPEAVESSTVTAILTDTKINPGLREVLLTAVRHFSSPGEGGPEAGESET